jgi:uncharacterized membrane protein
MGRVCWRALRFAGSRSTLRIDHPGDGRALGKLGSMSATLSSVRLMAHEGFRLGVWRPVELIAQVDWQAQWSLERPTALAHSQLFRAFVGLFVAAVLVAAVCFVMGVAMAQPFACLGGVALGLALLGYARHAADRDVIAMKPGLLRVERHRAGRMESVDFHPRWVRVEPNLLDGSVVRLSGQGRSVAVGEFVRRDLRRQLADEFRWALRHLD